MKGFNRIDQHLSQTILFGVLMTGFILIVLRSLFSLIDELGDLNKGHYQFIDAAYYVLMLVPARLYELFPMAVLIGGLMALGTLASQNELTVMRAMGISIWRIIASCLKVILPFMLLISAASEWWIPETTQRAETLKLSKMSEGQVTTSTSGIWAKSGFDKIHIKTILSKHRLEEVDIFQMDANGELKQWIHAQSAYFENKQWKLKQVQIKRLEETHINDTQHETYLWLGQLNANHIEKLSLEPQDMTLSELSTHIHYLQKNQLNSQDYRLAFWQKLAQPFALAIMLLLASAFIFGPMRHVTMGSRLTYGIILGFGFSILTKFFGPISLVYHLPPFFGAFFPLFIFALIAVLLLKKVK